MVRKMLIITTHSTTAPAKVKKIIIIIIKSTNAQAKRSRHCKSKKSKAE